MANQEPLQDKPSDPVMLLGLMAGLPAGRPRHNSTIALRTCRAERRLYLYGLRFLV
jgi:hypothetical protein